uniref:PiggyBac transposable element-derived protein 3-like n=1 Tax=Diabrotica virgifera virgifera TaxID=50390 RepID=A0A6P7G0D0_DIAVI
MEKKTSYIVPVRADVSDTESISDDENIESKHLDECLVEDSGDEYDEIKIGRNKYMEHSKQKADVPYPAIIKHYNRHMGGVDKANSLLGLYRSPSRARRWYYAIFTYLLDMCVVNAWLVYKHHCAEL